MSPNQSGSEKCMSPNQSGSVNKIVIHWFRRDLRLHDNHALYEALTSGYKVLCVFVFDTYILDQLEDKRDPRVTFIYSEIQHIKRKLEEMGSSLWTYYGDPVEGYKKLTSEFSIQAVYVNRDYEPYARERDARVAGMLKEKGIGFFPCKDHVFFENGEVMKDDQSPYTVFTPYSRKWKQKLAETGIPGFPSEECFNNFVKVAPFSYSGLQELGFEISPILVPPRYLDIELIRNYGKVRDIPSVAGTSRLGIHLRFGTVSIRELVSNANESGDVFLNELIWRDFFSGLMAAFPHVVTGAFRKPYDFIEWRNDLEEFDKWCRGETGFPLVDAGMRELNQTGFMHNRIRMVTASFLTKHLLIDWRWGEAYFASKLLDYDLASNNGNWQWAAGTGADAAPYFRVFNPELQRQKFDPENKYIKKWVPEYGTPRYPRPMADHAMARDRALSAYKKALSRE